MTGPSISVIVPTYNRAGVVAEALSSILTQEPAPQEVIVVDDGSTDDTAAVLAQFGTQIRVVQQANGGAASARNHGVRLARGAWVAFLDSDDLWLPGRIATFLRDINGEANGARADVVAHVGNLRFTGSDAQEVFAANGVSFPKGRAQRLAQPFDAEVPGPFVGCSVVRASALRAVGGFDETLPIHEDVLLFRLLALRGAWLVTGDAVSSYRRIEGDAFALMDWERDKPVAFYTSRVRCNATLLAEPGLHGPRRALVARDLSGAHFQLAAAYAAQGDRALARRSLVDSVTCHATPRSVLRALMPVVLGPRGYRWALARRHSSLRPDRPTTQKGA